MYSVQLMVLGPNPGIDGKGLQSTNLMGVILQLIQLWYESFNLMQLYHHQKLVWKSKDDPEEDMETGYVLCCTKVTYQWMTLKWEAIGLLDGIVYSAG